MKIEIMPGVWFDTQVAMDTMLPHLVEIGITGRQLERAMYCKEEKTARWVWDICDLYFNPYIQVTNRHPKATWDYFKQNNINNLAEILLRRKCIKALYQAWYKDRPEELTRNPKKEKFDDEGKARKGRRKNKDAAKSEPGNDEVPGHECSIDNNPSDRFES